MGLAALSFPGSRPGRREASGDSGNPVSSAGEVRRGGTRLRTDRARRGVLAVLLAAGWAVAAPMAMAEQAAPGPVVLGYVEFPPFTYTDSEGRPAGSLIEMVATVASNAQLALTLKAAPPSRLFPGIAAGTFDLFMGITTPQEFQGTTLVGESVIARIELDAYAMDEVPAVRRPEDLAGRSVIVIRGYSYAGWRPFLTDPANGITLMEVDSAEQGLATLRSGKAQLFLEYTLPMKLALAGRALPNLKSSPISVVGSHFVVSKKTRDAAAVLARLEASFKHLRDAGTLP